jgi:predicted ATPase
MIFLRAVKRIAPPSGEETYPLNTGVLEKLDALSFTAPVTFITGDNGSGKTTLLELIAQKLSANRIDSLEADKQEKAMQFAQAEAVFKAEIMHRPRRCLYFQAEGFIRYIDGYNAMKRDARMGLKEVRENASIRSDYAKTLASMPHARALHELNALYENDISARSHGEGFLDFFGARIADKGLYLLDEPEAALTFYNQYVLMNMLAQGQMKESQFIISTHSPVLLAYPDACIYEIKNGTIEKSSFKELENVRFLSAFLADTPRYTKDLFMPEE